MNAHYNDKFVADLLRKAESLDASLCPVLHYWLGVQTSFHVSGVAKMVVARLTTMKRHEELGILHR